MEPVTQVKKKQQNILITANLLEQDRRQKQERDTPMKLKQFVAVLQNDMTRKGVFPNSLRRLTKSTQILNEAKKTREEPKEPGELGKTLKEEEDSILQELGISS